MRRILALLSVVLLAVFTINCSSTTANSLAPDVPHQAQVDLDQSVALVRDLGAFDSAHGVFCSGTWVGPHTIMTAAHCVKGYARMRQQVQVARKLMEAGIPPEVLMLIQSLGMDPNDMDPADPEMPDTLRQIVVIMRSVPVEPALGLEVPYIVPSEVVDVGVAPTGLQHTTATYVNEKADIALLQVKGYMPAHNYAVLAEKSPLVGEDVTLVGNVGGNFFSFRKEQVSAYRHTEKYDGMDSIDGPFMQLSGSLVTHGDSGSGVFNERGELVGMASFVSETQLSYCVHLETIRGVFIGQRMLKAHIDVTAKDPKLTNDDVLNVE